MAKKEEVLIATATWTAIPDPLYYVDCPHCGNVIFMSKPSVIEKLKSWAKKWVSLQ